MVENREETKREIRPFYVVQRRQLNVQKNVNVQDCCQLLFCRSRCRRSCLSFLNVSRQGSVVGRKKLNSEVNGICICWNMQLGSDPSY